MGKEQIEFNLKRRMLTETGWVYFCRICGNYLNEDQFYKSKSSPFKIDTKCRLHYTKKNVDDDSSMNYLKLDPLSDEDFKGHRDCWRHLDMNLVWIHHPYGNNSI